mgnify:CR=1 FL=1
MKRSSFYDTFSALSPEQTLTLSRVVVCVNQDSVYHEPSARGESDLG